MNNVSFKSQSAMDSYPINNNYLAPNVGNQKGPRLRYRNNPMRSASMLDSYDEISSPSIRPTKRNNNSPVSAAAYMQYLNDPWCFGP